ncbi:MAG: hypothetical protein WD489_03610 [Rhodovibrionaceae bacterium]
MSAAGPTPTHSLSLHRRLSRLRHRAAAWAWFRLKSRIGGLPWLFYPLHLAMTGPKWRTLEVRADSALVIEGAMRCATSYAAAAVYVSQPGKIHVAHHLHVPAQIMRAAKLGVPALVLTREPEAAVRSLLLYDPHLDAAGALAAYRSFYAGCLPYAGDFVVATFAEATGDMAGVLAQINARFGTAFAPYRASPEEAARVEAVLERNNRTRSGGNPFTSYLPNPVKEAAKRRIDLSDHARELEACQALYARYRELAVRP